MAFKLNKDTKPDTVFLIKRSELSGRFDVSFNYNTKFNSLTSVFEEERLYKLCKPFSGGTPSKEKPEYWNGSIPWASPKDFNGLYLTQTEDFITEEGLKNSSTKLVPENSVLIVVRSGILIHTLPVTINKIPVSINQDLKAFVINDSRLIPEYLGMYFYVFGNKLLPIITKHSTTVQSINTEQFSSLKIPLPTLAIQQTIIDIMNKAIIKKQEKETKAQELLNSIDSYLLNELGISLPQEDNSLKNRIFSSKISDLSGSRFDPKLYDNTTVALRQSIDSTSYPTVKLKELIIQSCAGDWGLDETANVNEDFIKCLVIRATEFNNEANLTLDNSRVKYRLIHKNKLSKIDIQENDLLIEKSGGSIDQPVGRIAIITKEYIEENQLCYSNFIHKIRVDSSKVNPEYLFCFLKTMHNSKLTEAMQSQTNGIRNLIMSSYFKQTIILPKMTKQTEIAANIKSILNDIKVLQSDALNAIESAKQEIEKIILNTK